MAERARHLLLLSLALALAAAAHAQWGRAPPQPQPQPHPRTMPRPRYCQCIFQGQQSVANKQVCFPPKGSDGQSSCRSEMMPYIPDLYSEYLTEPQKMFRLSCLIANITTARKVCKAEGGRVAAPETEGHFALLRKLLKECGEWRIFLNYSDEKEEGKWTYDDGVTPAPNLPWRPDQPDNHEGDENCLEMNQNGQVNDYPCSEMLPFACERPLLKKVPEGYTYCRETRTFYKLYTEEKPYHVAKKTCELDGGKLAIPEDYDQVAGLIQKMGKYNAALVDFTDEAEEGNFVTSDGRSIHEMEFQVWRQREPDNGYPFGPPENCVVLDSSGYYMDVPCTYTTSFLCQLIPY